MAYKFVDIVSGNGSVPTQIKVAYEEKIQNAQLNFLVEHVGKKVLASDLVSQFAHSTKSRMLNIAFRNRVSLAPRAIPFAGIAVSLAVTGLEIAEVCDHLKELRDFKLAFSIDDYEEDNFEMVCGMPIPTLNELTQDIFLNANNIMIEMKASLPELSDVSPPQRWEELKGFFGANESINP